MKPNLLKYNDYMAESGRRLRHEREYMSDEFIAPLVALRRIDDQINDTFNTDEAIDLPITDSRIAMNLRFIETQLEEWRRENNTGRENRGTLHILCPDTCTNTLVSTRPCVFVHRHAIACHQPPQESLGCSATNV